MNVMSHKVDILIDVTTFMGENVVTDDHDSVNDGQ